MCVGGTETLIRPEVHPSVRLFSAINCPLKALLPSSAASTNGFLYSIAPFSRKRSEKLDGKKRKDEAGFSHKK